VAGDFVYAGLRDGRVLALHKDTGELRWEFGTGGAEYSSPVVYRGVLYVGSGDHKLYALDAVTGEERWSHVADSRIVSDPAVNEEVVAVVSLEGKLYILDAETGGRRLDFLTSATGGSPVFDEDWVWVAGQRGVVTAVDWRKRARPFEGLARRIRVQLFAWGMVGTVPPQKGFAWEAWQAGQSFVGTPVVDDGKVYVGSTSGALHALDRVTGEAIWTFHGDSKSLVSPSLAGNTVLVGDVEGRLYAVSAATGDELWRFNTGGRISSTPVIANGMLYVASWDGRLYAIE
jgi:outer membrane protein assembly factor BamB